MAHKIILRSRELNDLVSVISNSPKDYLEMFPETNLAGLHKYNKLIDELTEANVLYSDTLAELIKFIKPLQEELKSELENKDSKIAELNAKVEASPENLKVKEVGEKMIEVTINSDERFDILKQLFSHKTTIQKWINIKIMLSVDDAINSATKVE
jgi:uncharacterized protein YaaN involved in tellurite resistance